jgi:hypothetical protein
MCESLRRCSVKLRAPAKSSFLFASAPRNNCFFQCTDDQKPLKTSALKSLSCISFLTRPLTVSRFVSFTQNTFVICFFRSSRDIENFPRQCPS